MPSATFAQAMGENLHDDVDGETIDSKERRLRMLQAVEGDDWSSVIDGQTSSTVDPSHAAAAAEAQQVNRPQQVWCICRICVPASVMHRSPIRSSRGTAKEPPRRNSIRCAACRL